MISFGKFLEITAAGEPIQVRSPEHKLARKGGMVHGDGEPAHQIIPIVASLKTINMASRLRDNPDYVKKYAHAMAVIGRMEDQSGDGVSAAVYISNYEADVLKSMAEEIIGDSEKVMSSSLGGGVMDEAIRWISFGNDILKIIGDGVKAASIRNHPTKLE